MADDVLRMKATVVSDEALENIRKIGREIGLLPQRAGPSVKQLNTEFTTLGNTVKRISTELRAAVPSLGAFGFGAAGAGLAAGAMVRSLTAISDKLTQLKYSSRELGLAENALRGFALSAEKAAIAPEAMQTALQTFIRNANEFRLNIGAVREELYRGGAGDLVGAIARAKDPMKQLELAFTRLKALERTKPFEARMLAEQLFGTAQVLRLEWDQIASDIARFKPITAEQTAQAEKFRAAIIDLKATFDDLATRAGISLFPELAEDLKRVEKLVGLVEQLKGADIFKQRTPDRTPLWKPDLEKYGIPPWLFSPSIGNPLSGFREMPKGKVPFTAPGVNPLLGGSLSPVAYGDGFGAGGGLSEGSRMVKEGVFAALIDFQSYTQAGQAAGGGFTPASLTTGGYGGGGAGGGGAAGGGGGAPAGATLGDRNNNPGNLKFGAHAQSFGATHADSRGFAVFPNRASGEAAHETLIKSKGYSGLTLSQFAGKYAQGSGDWMRTVGKELGLGPNDIVNNQDPRLAGAIRKAEGTSGGSDIGRGVDVGGGGGKFGALPDQSGRPSQIHGSVTVGGQVFGYGSGGRGRGAIPFGDYPINIGKGDIGPVGKRIGSIATLGGLGGEIPDPRFPGAPREGIQIHAGSSEQLERLYTQGCFGVPRSQWPAFKEALLTEAKKGPLMLHIGRDGRAAVMSRSEFASGTSRIDAQVATPKLNASGTVNVNVTAPPGTKTSATSDGMFTNTTVKRSPQMQPTDTPPGPG